MTARRLSVEERKFNEDHLMAAFKDVLNQANYQQITETDLAYAMNRESHFKINLA